MFRLKFMKGTKVPQEARYLTRGENGLMQYWYDSRKEHMVATLAYQDGELIGWCCAVRVQSIVGFFFHTYTGEVEISTYVRREFRKAGVGKRLLERTTRALRLIEPRTIVRYGAPLEDAAFFNKTYATTITESGLSPDRYFCLNDDTGGR